MESIHICKGNKNKRQLPNDSTQQQNHINLGHGVQCHKAIYQYNIRTIKLNTQQTDNVLVNDGQSVSVVQSHLLAVQTEGDLCTIRHKQNEITSTLVKLQSLSSLPTRDIPVLDGDPLQYRNFIRAFEHGVESKANEADSRFFGTVHKGSAQRTGEELLV